MRPRLPGIGIAALAMLVAFALDIASGQRYSQLLGSAGLMVGGFALVPAARRIAVPLGSYIAVWLAFNLLRALGDDVPWADSTRDWVTRAERWLCGGVLPGVRLQGWTGHAPALEWLATGVYLSYFVVPHLVGIWLLRRDRARFRRYVTATGLLFGIGVLAFALVPSAPPWMATDGPARLVHNLLGGEGAARYGFDPNPIASFPSIHFGVTSLLVGVARGRWRPIALAYALAMGASLVYLGEHHLIDIFAAALISSTAWLTTVIPSHRAGVDTRPIPA